MPLSNRYDKSNSDNSASLLSSGGKKKEKKLKTVFGKRASESYDTLDPWLSRGTGQRPIAYMVHVMMLSIAVGHSGGHSS